MKQVVYLVIVLLLSAEVVPAQDFVTRGKIEFECKRNIKRMQAASKTSGDDPFASLQPDYDISYCDLLFANNQLLYQPGRKGTGSPFMVFPNENSAYTDLSSQKTVVKKYLIGDTYVYEDSLHKIRWKIENETRKIAGWECRKAVGRIYDSVYVVAFYCPEIIPQGGPQLFSGLPGMILGIAIPRDYITIFATKIEVANMDESTIVPPGVKKGKRFAKKELSEIIYKKYKEAGWWKDVTPEKVFKSLEGYTL